MRTVTAVFYMSSDLDRLAYLKLSYCSDQYKQLKGTLHSKLTLGFF